ncbi:MAG: hypothetical protein JWR34_185 [Mycobacterium sp.]|nr:hypothetical protein [Mycobacterium sp.]
MFDNHVNLSIGTVQVPPSPSTTGKPLTLMPGDATRFLPNMPVTLAPPNVRPTHDNAEIAYVTAINGSVVTLNRAQEGTTPMQVAGGWQVIGSLTAKTVTDLEAALSSKADLASLATVATTGSYTDLSDKPSIPDISDLVSNDHRVDQRNRQVFTHGFVCHRGAAARRGSWWGASLWCCSSWLTCCPSSVVTRARSSRCSSALAPHLQR